MSWILLRIMTCDHVLSQPFKNSLVICSKDTLVKFYIQLEHNCNISAQTCTIYIDFKQSIVIRFNLTFPYLLSACRIQMQVPQHVAVPRSPVSALQTRRYSFYSPLHYFCIRYFQELSDLVRSDSSYILMFYLNMLSKVAK